MALHVAGMPAGFLGFPTGLLTIPTNILTFTRPMTLLPTEVRPALQLLTAHFAATDLGEPTWLVFEGFLSTQASFLCQERTFRTMLLISMAIVRNAWMTASFGPFTLKSTRRRAGAAGQRRMENSLSTITTDLVKDSLPTATARSFMAQFGTHMVATFQRTSTRPSADMLCFKSLVDDSCSS